MKILTIQYYSILKNRGQYAETSGYTKQSATALPNKKFALLSFSRNILFTKHSNFIITRTDKILSS